MQHNQMRGGDQVCVCAACAPATPSPRVRRQQRGGALRESPLRRPARKHLSRADSPANPHVRTSSLSATSLIRGSHFFSPPSESAPPPPALPQHHHRHPTPPGKEGEKKKDRKVSRSINPERVLSYSSGRSQIRFISVFIRCEASQGCQGCCGRYGNLMG